MSSVLGVQPGDGGSTPTSALHSKWLIKPIDHKIAKSWIAKWHYSHRIPTGKNLSYGLFDGTELYAVIVYGIGVNPYQASFLGVKTVLELKRMCRSEPRRDYQLSRFIAISLRMVRQVYSCDALVSFSDPEQGHEGIVYKASGFLDKGLTNPEWHLMGVDGIKRHRRFAYRYARRNGITINEAREVLQLIRVKTLPKRRWVKYFV